MITQWAYWDNDNCFLIGRYYSANRWLTQSMWNFCNSRKLWSAMQKRVRGKFTFVEEWPNNVARLLIALLMRSVSFCWHTSVLCCSAMVSLPYSKLTVVSHSGLLSSSQRGHVDGVCKTTHKLIYFNCEPIQTYKHTYIHTTIQTNKPTSTTSVWNLHDYASCWSIESPRPTNIGGVRLHPNSSHAPGKDMR